jgi:hypothetical protein
MLLRFPREEEDRDNWLQANKLQSVLILYIEEAQCIYLTCDDGEAEVALKIPVNVSSPQSVHTRGGSFQVLPGTTYEEFFNGVESYNSIILEKTGMCAVELFKLVISLCMLGNDPTIIQPDVLSKDREAWEATGDWKYVEKARRRGKNGWEIGRNIEEQIAKEVAQEKRENGGVRPHWRNGCPALCWTGEGGRIPEIRWRNGCVVNREKLLAMPTGYLDEN